MQRLPGLLKLLGEWSGSLRIRGIFEIRNHAGYYHCFGHDATLDKSGLQCLTVQLKFTMIVKHTEKLESRPMYRSPWQKRAIWHLKRQNSCQIGLYFGLLDLEDMGSHGHKWSHIKLEWRTIPVSQLSRSLSHWMTRKQRGGFLHLREQQKRQQGFLLCHLLRKDFLYFGKSAGLT